MADDSRNTTVTVAIVGAVATVLAALIANWSNLTGHHGSPPPVQATTQAATPAAGPAPVLPVGAADDQASLTNASTAIAGPPAGSGFILPQSETRLLTASDIAGLSAPELRLARNEIYARHGRIFASADLAGYFSRLSWYHPNTTDVALSPLESRNVMFLLAAEHARESNG